MEDVIALIVSTVAVSLGSIWLFGKTTLGRAIARRIEGKPATESEEIDALHEEVQQLRDQVSQLRGENAEVLERLDFAERLLTRARDVPDSRSP